MSPKQQRERRLEVEQAAVNKIIEREYTLFRHDEALRAATYPEIIAALRKLKTRLRAQLKAAKHLDWVENTEALVDLKIEELLARQAKQEGKPVEEKAPDTIWLPKIFRRGIKPEQN